MDMKEQEQIWEQIWEEKWPNEEIDYSDLYDWAKEEPISAFKCLFEVAVRLQKELNQIKGV